MLEAFEGHSDEVPILTTVEAAFRQIRRAQ